MGGGEGGESLGYILYIAANLNTVDRLWVLTVVRRGSERMVYILICK